jgi:hypothetical protein
MKNHAKGNPVLKFDWEFLVSFDVIIDPVPFVALSPILRRMYILSRTAKRKCMQRLM